MSYNQWMAVQVWAADYPLKIKDFHLDWGKFYEYPDKDREQFPTEIDVPQGATCIIAACGRESAASGTEGSFSIYNGNLQVGSYYWDCPWAVANNNFFTWTAKDNNYLTEVVGGNERGEIGFQRMRCFRTLPSMSAVGLDLNPPTPVGWDTNAYTFVSVNIVPSNYEVTIRNIILRKGNLFQYPDTRIELPIPSVEGHVIRAGEIYSVSCVDDTRAAGSFDLFNEDYRIGTFSWECFTVFQIPPNNFFSWQTPQANPYATQITGAGQTGPLGVLTLISDTR